MYKFALDEKHIGHDDAPKFEYFDAIVDDDKIKRQVLTQKEWRHLKNYMIRQYSWHNPKITGTQLMVNRQFMLYIILNYETGCRQEGTRRPAMEAITKSVHLKEI